MRAGTDPARFTREFMHQPASSHRTDKSRVVALYASSTENSSRDFIENATVGRVRSQVVRSNQRSAEQLVDELATRMGCSGHLLLNVHGGNAVDPPDQRMRHTISLDDGQPPFPTETFLRMLVCRLDEQRRNMASAPRSLPFIHIFSCRAGVLRKEISADSDLWTRANLMIFSGTRNTSLLSSGSSLVSAMNYIGDCQRSQQPVHPLKLLYVAGLRRGDCLTLMGGKLDAPLVWHAPKSSGDQNDIRNLVGAPADIERLMRAADAIEPSHLKFLLPASLTEVMYNRITRDDAGALSALLTAQPGLEGEVPLHFAALARASQCLRLLLERGVAVDGRNADGRTVLFAAVLPTSPQRIDDIRALLAAGSDPNAQDHNDTSVLMLACQDTNPEIVEVLLMANADPDLQCANGDTALSWAAKSGRTDNLALLLSYGANPDLYNADGHTALMKSVIAGDVESAQVLLQGGADPDLQDSIGATALFHAVRRNDHAMIDLLIGRGARLDVMTFQGISCLQLAATGGHDDTVSQLLAAGAGPADGLTQALADAVRAHGNQRAALLLQQALDAHVFAPPAAHFWPEWQDTADDTADEDYYATVLQLAGITLPSEQDTEPRWFGLAGVAAGISADKAPEIQHHRQ